jgi:hypothetical protein
MTRLRGFLAIVVMLMMLGASSQTAVCELMCGLHVGDDCHLATPSGTAHVEGPHAHCGHQMSRMQQTGHEAEACGDTDCGHASIPDFVKGDSTLSHAFSVEWVVVDVVPVVLRAVPTGGSMVRPPPLLLGGVDPLSVSLRV